ncbi:MAG: hypothetical protein VX656_09090 [Candidatus Latescibacterota bacterium]|nr:hypothetical protein [Candidatus Latescibacterota bacterium]
MSTWRDRWAHAFAIEDAADETLEADEQELIERLAEFVVRRRMSSVALMTLESSRPLNFVGSQALAFLSPLLTLIFNSSDVDRFIRLLEKRRSVDLICDTILELETARDD